MQHPVPPAWCCRQNKIKNKLSFQPQPLIQPRLQAVIYRQLTATGYVSNKSSHVLWLFIKPYVSYVSIQALLLARRCEKLDGSGAVVKITLGCFDFYYLIKIPCIFWGKCSASKTHQRCRPSFTITDNEGLSNAQFPQGTVLWSFPMSAEPLWQKGQSDVEPGCLQTRNLLSSYELLRTL